MDAGNQSQEQVAENFRKQLALAVRSIQWSYAIFWSVPSNQPGVLEWGDGYYNGDIKTRKTVQAVEVNEDPLGLQRSEQLRELYTSLSANETIPEAKRPTAALSPEDLTDTEWYYLVCMSFVFNIGQGLPGRTFAKNQPIWLCNAHRADTKVFSRSLLAKSASVQTVVCFPHLGGVVELGATELVTEDQSLIQSIRTSFLECPNPVISELPNGAPNNIRNEINLISKNIDKAESSLNQLADYPDAYICSPESSDAFGGDEPREESNMVGGIDGEAFQMADMRFMDEEMSNGVNNSMNSSDCVSQNYDNPESTFSLSKGKKATDNGMQETQECNQQKSHFDLQGDDIHYQSVLSTLLKSHQLSLGPYFNNSSKNGSSFVSWKKNALSSSQISQTGTPQRLLKQVLFEVSKMHENRRLESSKGNGKKDGSSKPEADDVDRNHVLSERKRREKINERFMILGSLVPSGGKVDKVSILDNTIEYLRELERRVGELEAYKDTIELESGNRTKPHDAIERTSDNYGTSKTSNGKKLLTNKRKASDMDGSRPEKRHVLVRDSTHYDISIRIVDKDVFIEMTCAWRESILLDVMEAISKLHLDSHTVQSSSTNGVISLTINAKIKASKVLSPVVIRQALQKVIKKG